MMFIVLISIFFANPFMASASEKHLFQSLPQTVGGWKVAGKPEVYTQTTIFDYMDGAGEIYRAYSFRSLVVQRYAKQGNHDIVIEIFDMGSSDEAFGVFSYGQGSGKKKAGIGHDSEYKSGLLTFWKDRFYISVYTMQETSANKKAIIALGKSVSNAIRKPGKKPFLLGYMPAGDVVEDSIRYFHHEAILRYHYFVADTNILNIGDHTKAVLARYRDSRSVLLLIHYENKKKSVSAFKRFTDTYMPDAGRTGIIQVEDGTWTGAQREGEFIAIVFEAPTKDDVQRKIKAVMEVLLRHEK